MYIQQRGSSGLPLKTLYITNHDIGISCSSSHINFRSKGRLIGKIPLIQVRQIVISEGVPISSGVIQECLEMDIPVTFIRKDGSLSGHLLGCRRYDPSIRLSQYKIFSNHELKLIIARKFVDAKIANCIAVLRKFYYNHKEDCEMAAVAKKLSNMRKNLDVANNEDQIRGIEGSSAREYFSVFGDMIRKNFTFSGRTKQPPKDPVNALLSLGYTLIAREAASILEACGLDSYVGFLHELKPGRPSLALDIIEPLRIALIDRFVINSINLEKFNYDDFQKQASSDGGVLLNDPGRKKFFSLYEEWMANCTTDLIEKLSSPRSVLEEECEKFKNMICSENIKEWKPITI